MTWAIQLSWIHWSQEDCFGSTSQLKVSQLVPVGLNKVALGLDDASAFNNNRVAEDPGQLPDSRPQLRGAALHCLLEALR